MQWYRDKRVFITGGSSGIGKAAARMVAEAGGHVSVAARGQDRLDQTLSELKELGAGDHHAISVDVSDREAVREAVSEVLDALGGIDVIINNAGFAIPGYVHELSADEFEAMMDVNYFGIVNVTRAFLPTLREQRSGHICNVSSTLGFLGCFGYTGYAASKHAIAGFSECLRQELITDNVGVSIVYPPDTDTPQFHRENEVKPPETKMLSEGAGLLQPEDVAKEMLVGIMRNKPHITPGFNNKFIRFANNHFPWLVRWVMHNDLKKFARR
jgi:3-dehydrosphinganine reductase